MGASHLTGIQFGAYFGFAVRGIGDIWHNQAQWMKKELNNFYAACESKMEVG